MRRWLACGEDQVPVGTRWLSEREVDHLGRLAFTKRRTEFLLRRRTGKLAVAEALGLGTDDPSLARVEILNQASGAPYVEIDRARGALDLSLTDRAGWAVCLVGGEDGMAGGTLGVDLEIVEPRSPGFVADFLTPAEQEYVASCGPGDGWDAAANLIWSAKEAALKVMRVGLRADTRSVEVRIGGGGRSDGWRPLRVVHADGRVFEGWWRRDGVFLLTLALLEPGEPPGQLVGSADLAAARPVHSWVHSPVVPVDVANRDIPRSSASTM